MTPAHHPRGGHLILALVCALAAYAAGYVSGSPLVLYLPVDGVWAASAPAGEITMGYYGLLVEGALGWFVGWGVSYLPPVRRRLQEPGAVSAGSRLAIVALVLALLIPVVKEVAHALSV